MNDSVIAEIYQVKDAIAREHRNDVHAILAYARRQFPKKNLKPVARRPRKKPSA